MDSVSDPQTATRNPVVLIAPFFLWGTAMVAMKGAMPHTAPFFMAGLRLVPAGGGGAAGGAAAEAPPGD